MSKEYTKEDVIVQLFGGNMIIEHEIVTDTCGLFGIFIAERLQLFADAVNHAKKTLPLPNWDEDEDPEEVEHTFCKTVDEWMTEHDPEDWAHDGTELHPRRIEHTIYFNSERVFDSYAVLMLKLED